MDSLPVPEEFKRHARRFLYYQLFKASLPFDEFIEAHPTAGYVQLKSFSWQELTVERSQTMRVLVEGIVQHQTFFLPDAGVSQ